MLDDDDAFGPLQVLHAPGHSPGPPGVLVAGAQLPDRRRCDRDLAVALRRLDGVQPEPKQHAASVRRMAALDARVVGVGHGEPITEDAADRVHALAV